jgi:NADH-quinone oxidoreductase subunit N
VLSFAGLPFTGGFLGKFYVFAAAYEAGWWSLVLIGVIATAVSLYYYLGIVKALYMRPGPAPGPAVVVTGGSPPRDAALGLGVAAAVAVTVGSFFFVQPLVDLATEAAASLPW